MKVHTSAWYRFLKVLYGAGFFLVLMVTLFTFLVSKPSGHIEVTKSGFTCNDGRSYVWNSFTGYYTKKDTALNVDDHVNALQTCGNYNPEFFIKDLDSRKAAAKEAGFSDIQIEEALSSNLPNLAEKVRLDPPYTLDWVTDESDSSKWKSSIVSTFTALIISYFLMETIKNVIIYIFYGKRFTYPLLSLLFKK